MGDMAIVAYRPKAGLDGELLGLVKAHVPSLRRLGLATDRPASAMRGKDGAAWTSLQLLEAIGMDDAPKYLLRDNDAIYGTLFRRKVASLGPTEVVTALRSPWQNPYVERVIGSLRRECLDHSIILGEHYLRRVVDDYGRYYNGARTHLSLAKDAPVSRRIYRPGLGRIVSRRHCGGLHHEYLRKTA